jgi:hypothetical protein
VVPVFLISIPPDKDPLQSVLPVQVEVTSTLHGSACANAEVDKEIPATMMHKQTIINMLEELYVVFVFINHLPFKFFIIRS